jgi:hypothetical protein
VAESQRDSLQGVARAVRRETATTKALAADRRLSARVVVGSAAGRMAEAQSAARSEAISAFDGMRRLKSKAAWT